MKSKAIVLLSGGLDSSVNLYAALHEKQVLRVLTFNYGQRAFEKEKVTAFKLCQGLKLDHQIIELPWLKDCTASSLVDLEKNVPVGEDVKIDNYQKSIETAKAVWVPNRNGVFLNVAAAIAESLNADEVIVGFNAEEASTFPDNSLDYIEATNRAFEYSTANQVRVKCFTSKLDKVEIVKMAIELGVPLNDLWPCYFSGERLCGKCESCQRFYRALKKAGVSVEI